MNSKAQTSIEVIILVVVVIGLATFVVSRYTLQQSDIFVMATAREAFLGEADVNLTGSFYLARIHSRECSTSENEFRVALFVNPDPDALEKDRLENNIKNKIQKILSERKEVEVKINPSLDFTIC